MFPTRGAFRFFNVPAVLHAACSNRPSRSLSRGSPPVVFPWARAVPLLSFFRQSMPAPLPLFFPGSPRQLPCLRCPIVSAATALSSPRLRTRDRMLQRALTPPRRSAPVAAPVPGRAKKESGSLRTAPRIVPLRATTPGPPAAPQPKGYSSSGSFMLW